MAHVLDLVLVGPFHSQFPHKFLLGTVGIVWMSSLLLLTKTFAKTFEFSTSVLLFHFLLESTYVLQIPLMS